MYVKNKIWPWFLGLLSSATLEHALVGFNNLNFMEIQCFPALWKPPKSSLFLQKGKRLVTYQKATPTLMLKRSITMDCSYLPFSIFLSIIFSFFIGEESTDSTGMKIFVENIRSAVVVGDEKHPAVKHILELARCLSTLLRFSWQPLRKKTSIQ